MALIECDECSKEFSDKAAACPNCGNPNETTNVKYIPIDIDCDVEINGDEVDIYYDENSLKPNNSKQAKIATFAWFVLCVIFFFSVTKPHHHGENFMSITFLFIVGGIVIGGIDRLTPWYKQEKQRVAKLKKRIESVKRFFEKKFPIHKNMAPEFEMIDASSFSGKNKEQLLFEIYMKAYQLNAHAIVINSDTVATEIRGNVSSSFNGRHVKGTTSSTTTHDITATFVKYK